MLKVDKRKGRFIPGLKIFPYFVIVIQVWFSASRYQQSKSNEKTGHDTIEEILATVLKERMQNRGKPGHSFYG